MSLPIVGEAAISLVDSIPVFMSLAPRLIGLDEEGALTQYLQEGLDVSVVGESAILEFSFTSVAPRISLMVSGALRDAFIKYHVFGRKNSKAVAYYEEQITSVRAEIDSLLNLRTQALRKGGYTSLKDEVRYETGRLVNLEAELSEAVVVRKELEVEYNILEGYLDGDPRDFPMGHDENQSHILVTWRNTLGRYDNELNVILVVHTAESEVAKQKQILIDKATESLKREQKKLCKKFLSAGYDCQGKRSYPQATNCASSGRG